MTDPDKRSWISREIEFLLGDFRLWLQKRESRRNAQKVIRDMTAGPPGADLAELVDADGEGRLVRRGSAFSPLSLPARAIPKWSSRRARSLRIVLWRLLRPALRWRRAHTLLADTLFWGLVLGTSAWLTHAYLSSSTTIVGDSAPSLHEEVAVDDPDTPPSLMSLEFDGKLPKALRLSPELPENLTPMEIGRRADIAFSRGDFAEAERLYRQILHHARRKPLLLFRIFLCLVRLDRMDEAEKVLALMPPMPVGKSPANYLARAALAKRDGDEQRSQELIEEARSLFPLVVSSYERALLESGL